MALETAAELGLQVIWKTSKSIYKGWRGSDCKQLEQTANSLLPIVREICDTSPEAFPDLSLKNFSEFCDKLARANRLVDEHKETHNPIMRSRINNRAKKTIEFINEFIQNDLQLYLLSTQTYLFTKLGNVQGLQAVTMDTQVSLLAELETVRARVDSVGEAVKTVGAQVVNVGEAVKTVGAQVVNVGEAVETGVQIVLKAVENVHQGLSDLMSKVEEEQTKRSQQNESLCRPPDTPSDFLGFEKHIVEVKTRLLANGVKVVGITAMGGAGKSTLAKAVCHHNDIKEYFQERVIYIVVSQSPDLLCVLKTMWSKIVGRAAPDFENVEDAHDQLQLQINSRRNEPILVVLDDIWQFSELEVVLFEGEHYKTLVTTRDKDVIQGPRTSIFDLPLLEQGRALELFCRFAFGKSSIPSDRNKELVEKVQQECEGLPLALIVIGRSLYGKSDCDWERTKKRLSAGEPSKDDHKKKILNKLKTSIDVLDKDEKQCFLDLGAFQQRKTVPAKALLDIWVYVRGMESYDAETLLRKFEDRHLLDLKGNPGTAEITDDCMNGYSISQHDVMRDLALYLANQDNSIQRRRLHMPKMENCFRSEWKTDRDLSSKAQIISINTGVMKDTEWPEMEFPEAEALVLYFTASEYCIPTFLHTMKKLKVLIIHNNDGAKRAKLSGVAGFQALSQLKTLHLERVIVHENCIVLESLEKLYMSLCEGLDRDKTFNLPGLLEFNVDYCIDLEELPAGLCSSIFLKILSVTHCHRLTKLPAELDKLESLKEIRLFESLGLEALPSSICSLKKLKFLDISSCIHLKVKTKERSELKETLQTLAKLPSLKRVICDKENEQLFKMSSRTDLKVEGVVEKEPSLDWLD